jgi:hypothetical protein
VYSADGKRTGAGELTRTGKCPVARGGAGIEVLADVLRDGFKFLHGLFFGRFGGTLEWLEEIIGKGGIDGQVYLSE